MQAMGDDERKNQDFQATDAGHLRPKAVCLQGFQNQAALTVLHVGYFGCQESKATNSVKSRYQVTL